MDEEELFDEFGNPIGDPAIGSDMEDDFGSSPSTSDNEDNNITSDDRESIQNVESVKDLMLGNDTYGEAVEVLVETENTQLFNEPLVKPNEPKSKGSEYSLFSQLKKNMPQTKYDRQYMLDLLSLPERIRNVAVIGPLHSGKTSLVDLMIIESHKKLSHITKNVEQGWKSLRYMDNLRQEVERGISIKLNGFTFMSTDLNDKSMVYNMLDSPGHVNFMDETAVALEAADIAVICIDIVEGVTSIVEKLIKLCEKKNLKMVFVLNKIDRLILEMKLPPLDTYLKLKHTITRINSFTKEVYSPELDNIVFASTKLGFTFTTREFVKYYYSNSISDDKIEQFINKLYGNYTYSKGRFQIIQDPLVQKPTFHDFILLPLYKIIGYSLSLDEKKLKKFTTTLKQHFNIVIPESERLLRMDPLPLLRYICQLIFKNKQTGLYHSINTVDINISVQKSSNSQTVVARALKTLDYGGQEFSLVRIYSGTLQVGREVNIIDSNKEIDGAMEDNDDEDDDDFEKIVITELALLGGRYYYNVNSAGPGQIVLAKNISHLFEKSCTIFSGFDRKGLPKFGSIDYINSVCFKVIIEPLVPKELPKLMDALIKVSKYYPGLVTKVEESGEHVIIGSGELYLDCLLYDLRKLYAKIEIKISDPVTIFTESSSKESFTSIPVTSSKGDISLSISAKPLDAKLLRDLSQNKKNELDIENEIASGNTRKLSKMLRTEYGWDSLTARNIWTFHHSNIFVDDTLPDETDKNILKHYKQQIKQGFYWAVREGPLCEEYIYGIQFNLLKFEINETNGNKHIGSQLIPMIRKACYIGMMTAGPILMEPIYEVDVIVKTALIPIVEELFKRRRGARIYKTEKIGGSLLSELRGQIPVIESIGLETDLRLSTNGGAMCQLQFWKKIWRKVPGDVLDEEAIIPKLKPAPYESLSRDFVMKTRRRKGISNEVFMSNDGPSLGKYIDPELFEQLKANELI